MKSFKNRDIGFWQCQLIGWGCKIVVTLLGNSLNQYGIAKPGEVRLIDLSEPVIWEVLLSFIGFTMTLFMRPIYRWLLNYSKKILTIVLISIPITFFFSIIWHVLEMYLIQLFTPELKPVFNEYIIAIAIGRAPILLGWSLFYFGIKFWQKWNLEHDRAEKASLLAQSAQLQMLRYQLNPHFLFNSLNSIWALIDEDKKASKEMVSELAEFLRYSLVSKNFTDVPLNQELEAIKHYFSIEKKRFEEKLEVLFDIDAESENYPVLSFLLHPLVENAVKYGMKTGTLPLRIMISAKVNDGNLTLLVKNSGKWIPPSENTQAHGTGTGLKNIRLRLDNAFAGRNQFEIKQEDDFVVARIKIFKKN
jgi:hypothetical protein